MIKKYEKYTAALLAMAFSISTLLSPASMAVQANELQTPRFVPVTNVRYSHSLFNPWTAEDEERFADFLAMDVLSWHISLLNDEQYVIANHMDISRRRPMHSIFNTATGESILGPFYNIRVPMLRDYNRDNQPLRRSPFLIVETRVGSSTHRDGVRTTTPSLHRVVDLSGQILLPETEGNLEIMYIAEDWQDSLVRSTIGTDENRITAVKNLRGEIIIADFEGVAYVLGGQYIMTVSHDSDNLLKDMAGNLLIALGNQVIDGRPRTPLLRANFVSTDNTNFVAVNPHTRLDGQDQGFLMVNIDVDGSTPIITELNPVTGRRTLGGLPIDERFGLIELDTWQPVLPTIYHQISILSHGFFAVDTGGDSGWGIVDRYNTTIVSSEMPSQSAAVTTHHIMQSANSGLINRQFLANQPVRVPWFDTLRAQLGTQTMTIMCVHTGQIARAQSIANGNHADILGTTDAYQELLASFSNVLVYVNGQVMPAAMERFYPSAHFCLHFYGSTQNNDNSSWGHHHLQQTEELIAAVRTYLKEN